MQTGKAAWIILVLIPTLTGCWPTSKPPVTDVVTKVPAEPPRFQDVTREVGIDFRMNFLPNEQGDNFKVNLYDHGCGLATGDYDGDGNDDLYFLNQLGANALYRNRGNGTFEDVTSKLGVELEDRISVGATFADYDNDGDQDLFVTSTRGGNVLFRNEDGNGFVDATSDVGLAHVGHSQTAAFFDYDNDGWLDLLVVQTAEWTKDTFDEVARYYLGEGDTGFEGLITTPIEHNILYHNEGNGTFKEVTKTTGIQGMGWAGDLVAFDYDEDGWLDVLITSMFGRAQLYHNEAGQRFADVTLDKLGRTPFGAVGARVFDFDNDGHLDIYIVDMHSDMWTGVDYDHETLGMAREFEKKRFPDFYGPSIHKDGYRKLEAELEDLRDFKHSEVLFGNAFYRNKGDGEFDEISQENNLESFWPWGIAAGDFDNDRFIDVFVASGMGYPFYYWPNYLFMNRGNGHFASWATKHGLEPPAEGETLDGTIRGHEMVRSSRCAVTGDFDGDGRLEIVVNNFNHEPYFYKNEYPPQNYVAFRLQGSRSNRDAIGAMVRVTIGNDTLVRQVHAASGYLSHSSKTLHFGLGNVEQLEGVQVHWPSGQVQTLATVAANQLHEIIEPKHETQ